MRSKLHPSFERGRQQLPDRPVLKNTVTGYYVVPGPIGRKLVIIASDGSDWPETKLPKPAWEHVSVRAVGAHRLSVVPTWQEMCWVKDQFWEESECVMQLHPPKGEYLNVHDAVLHLWKPVGPKIPRPPRECV